MKNQEVKKSMETKDNESGRSMVEMLGVLAIMGVLAIGGIAGYRWAMDKYNANEILNEVRKRAVTASQQRILGHAINLSEYGNNGQIQGKYAVTITDNYDEDTNFFTITVKGIEQNICEKVLAETIPFAVDTWLENDIMDCQEGNNNAVAFAFANTLAPVQLSDWEDTPISEMISPVSYEGTTLMAVSETGSEWINLGSMYTISGSNGIWSSETRSKSVSDSSEYTVSGSESIWSTEPESFSSSGSSEYTVSGSDGIWSTEPESFSSSGSSEYTVSGSDGIWGTVTAIQGKSCSSNEECVDDTGMRDETQYCDIEHYEWIGSTDACYANLRGTCRDKGDALTQKNGVWIDGLGTVWKGPYGTWWSARNWCAAHRKSLISKSGLQCGYLSYVSDGYCCAKDQASCVSAVDNQSAIMQALRTAYANNPGKLPYWFWTATPYNSKSDNSCSALLVPLSGTSAGFYLTTRNASHASALCE